MQDYADLDRVVDYAAEYVSIIRNHKVIGNNLTGLCPFHSDTKNSFSVNLRTGQWNCFAGCGSGNFISFWARYHLGADTEENRKTAYRDILAKYRIFQENFSHENRNDGGLSPYTIEQYSFDKRLPVDFLKQICRVETGKDRDGTKYLKIPYFCDDGTEAAIRKRYGQKEFRWKKGSKGKICDIITFLVLFHKVIKFFFKPKTYIPVNNTFVYRKFIKCGTGFINNALFVLG